MKDFFKTIKDQELEFVKQMMVQFIEVYLLKINQMEQENIPK